MPPIDPDKIPTFTKESEEETVDLNYQGPSLWILIGLVTLAIGVIMVVARFL